MKRKNLILLYHRKVAKTQGNAQTFNLFLNYCCRRIPIPIGR